MIIAFQGEPGAFSEEAAVAFADGAEVTLFPCKSFIDVVSAVIDRKATHGVLPTEGSLIGKAVSTADGAANMGLTVVRKMNLPIQYALLATAGTRIESLERVLSHSSAFTQCSRFFAAHPMIESIEWIDSGAAAKDVAISADINTAALTSRRAALHYKLEIIADNIADGPGETQFVVVGKR